MCSGTRIVEVLVVRDRLSIQTEHGDVDSLEVARETPGHGPRHVMTSRLHYEAEIQTLKWVVNPFAEN